jgi:hypothetical protein
LDIKSLPAAGEEVMFEVELVRPSSGKKVGTMTLLLRG